MLRSWVELINLESTQLELWKDANFLLTTMTIHAFLRKGPSKSILITVVWYRWRITVDAIIIFHGIQALILLDGRKIRYQDRKLELIHHGSVMMFWITILLLQDLAKRDKVDLCLLVPPGRRMKSQIISVT